MSRMFFVGIPDDPSRGWDVISFSHPRRVRVQESFRGLEIESVSPAKLEEEFPDERGGVAGGRESGYMIRGVGHVGYVESELMSIDRKIPGESLDDFLHGYAMIDFQSDEDFARAGR